MLIEQGAWWIGAALLLAASLLARYAFFGRRVGDTPFCRKCRYNLTGVTIDDAGARCPECGIDVTVRTPLRGSRPSRPAARIATTFIALLTIGVFGLAFSQAAGRIKPIQYLPESWLIARVERGVGLQASDAFTELLRRQALWPLSPKTIARLIEAELKEQAAASKPMSPGQGFTARMLEDLTTRIAAGEASEAQIKRFVANAMKPMQVRTRPRVPRNREMLAEFDLLTLVGQKLELRTSSLDVRVDGKKSSPRFALRGGEEFQNQYASFPLFVQKSTDMIRIDRSPGPVKISVELKYRIQRGETVLGDGKAVAEHELEVMPPTYELNIATVTSDEIDQAISRLYHMAFLESADLAGFRGRLKSSDSGDLMIRFVSDHRIATQFCIVLEHDGRQYRSAHDVSRPAAASRGGYGTTTFPVPWKPERVFLVADVEAAEQQTLYDSIWGRALRFENIPTVEQSQVGHSTQPVGVAGEVDTSWTKSRLKSLPPMPPAFSHVQPRLSPFAPTPKSRKGTLLDALFPRLPAGDRRNAAESPTSRPTSGATPPGGG